MEERRAKGLCFSCDEKFVKGHRCSALGCLLIVEVDEDMTDHVEEMPHDYNDVQPEISVHAYSGTFTPRTM